MVLVAGLALVVCGSRYEGSIPPALAEPVNPVSASAPALDLPAPGTRVGVSAAGEAAMLLGMTIHPEDPLQFDFIVDQGDRPIAAEALRDEADRLIKYFLVALAVPEDELWVNLSPYEKDRIIPETLGRTEMGRDLLSLDYILKQLTASLIYPADDLGQAFWARVYEQAQVRYGTTRIPLDTFNKVWIVPETADVYLDGNRVFITDSHLKVLIEEDYLARAEAAVQPGPGPVDGKDPAVREITSAMVREVVIPEIEREVNEGSQFGRLRQIYHAMILATWYKENLQHGLLGKVYANKKRTGGLAVVSKDTSQRIYDQYVKAFQQGVFQLVQEEFDASTQEIVPRKYFSGGVDLAKTAKVSAGVSSPVGFTARISRRIEQGLVAIFRNRFRVLGKNGADVEVAITGLPGPGQDEEPPVAVRDDNADQDPALDGWLVVDTAGPELDGEAVVEDPVADGAGAMRAEDYPVSEEVARHYTEELANPFRYNFENLPAATQRILSYGDNYQYLLDNGGDLSQDPVIYVMIGDGFLGIVHTLGEDFVREHFRDLVDVIKLYRREELQGFYYHNIPKLVEVYGLDFVKTHWAAIIRMCRTAGVETGFLLREALPALLETLEGDSVFVARKMDGLARFVEAKGVRGE